MSIFLVVYAYIAIQMMVVWGLYRLLKNPSVVDVSWSLGLMVSGLIYLIGQPISLRSLIVAVLLIVWALRLAGYLWYTRIRKGHVDKRYLELSNQWKMSQSLGFFLNFQLQGFFIFILSITFYFIPHVSGYSLSMLDKIALLTIIIGIMGESLADFQLQAFRKAHPGRVCNAGLWQYTRHPNYFFDWLTWCGFFLFAVTIPYGYLSMVSPLLLLIIFTKITGPITERSSIASRGQAFLDYQKNTSMFFPWVTR